jgi:hypothetical protein
MTSLDSTAIINALKTTDARYFAANLLRRYLKSLVDKIKKLSN